MSTKLEKVIGEGRYGRVDAPEPKPTKLAKLNLVGGRGAPVELPGIGPAWVQLLPHRDSTEVESETQLELEALKLINSATGLRMAFDAIQAVRTLARAVRDPDDPSHKTPFGTLEQWQSLDEDLIAAAWQAYADVRYQLNPLDTMQLTDRDLAGIGAALEKKSAPLLRSYGVAKLSLYLLTSGSPPASSTTSPSSDGESSPASSTSES